jgi:hypothetical protein
LPVKGESNDSVKFRNLHDRDPEAYHQLLTRALRGESKNVW